MAATNDGDAMRLAATAGAILQWLLIGRAADGKCYKE